MKEDGICSDLVAQFERIFRHNRQGSYRTKYRYREAYLRFLAFVADYFRLRKIRNVSPKHVHGYVRFLFEKGRKTSYVKTELAAIRFWHDQIPNTRYRLPTNEELGLGKRKFLGVDRTWSQPEFDRACKIAADTGRRDYVAVLCLARYAALRLHECFRMDTRSAEAAVKNGVFEVKGKGGLVREVPSTPQIDRELRKMLDVTPRGQKLFVRSDDKTHLAMSRLEAFLSHYRDEIKDPDSNRPLHFHGLRHTCSVEWYQQFLQKGMSDRAARLAVARLLGHGRDGVTRIYLASIEEGRCDDDK